MNISLGDVIDLANTEHDPVRFPKLCLLIVSTPVLCQCDACIAYPYSATWETVVMQANGKITPFSFVASENYLVIG